MTVFVDSDGVDIDPMVMRWRFAAGYDGHTVYVCCCRATLVHTAAACAGTEYGCV